MKLNSIPKSGQWNGISDRLNENFSKIIAEVESLGEATIKNCGYFSTLEALQEAYPIAGAGSKAYVGTSYPYAIYLWNTASSAWVDSGATGGEENVKLEDYYTKENVDEKITELESETHKFKGDVSAEMAAFEDSIREQIEEYKPIIINGDVTNAADEEDITSEDGLLKLKDRNNLNGMGYIILRRDKSFAEQLTQANTIYEIRYDFDLNGEEVTIPEDCVLDFQGGSLSNGDIILRNTTIVNPKFKECSFSGSCINDFYNIESFGAVRDSSDCSKIINDIIKLYSNGKSKSIFIPVGVWNISSPIVLWAGWDQVINLFGTGYRSVLNQVTDNEYIIKKYETTNIHNITLRYKNQQSISDEKAIAVAVARSCFSSWNNINICNANTAFGYIRLSDYDENALNNVGFCYVNDSFDVIRCYRCSGYAFDFSKKEVDIADSGSYYANIYISSNDPYTGDAFDCKGAIKASSTNCVFGQLNIEGRGFNSTLIEVSGYSNINIDFAHIEHVDLVSGIYAYSNPTININAIELQYVKFVGTYSKLILQSLSTIKIKTLKFRSCSKKEGIEFYMFSNEGDGTISVDSIIYQQTYPSIFNNIIVNSHNGNYNIETKQLNTVKYADAVGNLANKYGVCKLLNVNKSDESTVFNNLLAFYDKNGVLKGFYTYNFLDKNANITKPYGYKSSIPVFKEGENIGFQFFNRNINSPIFWDGGTWRCSDGYLLQTRSGTTETRPTPNVEDKGVMYYDTDLNQPMWWDGSFWRLYDGNIVIAKSGTYEEKPNTPKVGTSYFCTNRQTQEGGTNGIVIYHKGDNVWVDALGRIVE